MEFSPELMLGASALSGAALAAATYGAFMWPPGSLWGPVVSRGTPSPTPRVALTFDDGPTPSSTPRVLDVLGELNVKAAFFVIGRYAAENPELLQRMNREGHIVANHSYDHWMLGCFRHIGYWEQQLHDTDVIIEKIIGKKPALFRPPMGIRTWPIARAAKTHQLKVITWTRRALDGIQTTSEKILDRLMGRTQAGEILCMHDGVAPGVKRDPAVTVAAIRPLVEGLRGRGLELTRLDEVIGTSAYR